MSFARILLALCLVGCAQEAKKPDIHAKCVVTEKNDWGDPIGRLCEWQGYLWQCDQQDCVRLHSVNQPRPEAP